MGQDKYLRFLDTLTKSNVTAHSIVALLMEEFPELGITGAMLIVEYWQDISIDAQNKYMSEQNEKL